MVDPLGALLVALGVLGVVVWVNRQRYLAIFIHLGWLLKE